MAIYSITEEREDIVGGNDDIVFKSVLEEIVGGRTVDITGYPLKTIYAGQVVTRETATDKYSLLPVSVDGSGVASYGALPDGFEYVGLVRASKPVDLPFVSIAYSGTANDKAMVIKPTDAIKTAIVTALPKLTFKAD
jgi:hypothetical protein